MKRIIILTAFLFSISFFISCKKETVNSFNCSNLQQGIKSDSVELVKQEINKICAGLAEPTVEQMLQKLTETLSSKCNMNATLLCSDCIQHYLLSQKLKFHSQLVELNIQK